MTAPKRGTKGKQRAAVRAESKSAAGNGPTKAQLEDELLVAEGLADILSQELTEAKAELDSLQAELAAKEASLNAALAQAQQELDGKRKQVDVLQEYLGGYDIEWKGWRLVREHATLQRDYETLRTNALAELADKERLLSEALVAGEKLERDYEALRNHAFAELDAANKLARDWALNHHNEKRRADREESRGNWWNLSALLVALLALVGFVWEYNYYQTHPVETTYRPQEIIVQQGDVLCPNLHTCTWKAWDLDTDTEVPR